MDNQEETTIGKSNLPERTIHHITFYYRRVGKSSLLAQINCRECGTNFQTTESLRNNHPTDQYLLAKQIQHIGAKRKKLVRTTNG